MESDWLIGTNGVDKPTLHNIRAGEDRAFRTWPAESCVEAGGWVLRHTRNTTTRRTNSVCPNLLENVSSVESLIAKAETFYKKRGLSARYKISPAAKPVDLDERLQSQGYYGIEAPVLVQWASCTDVLSVTPSPHKAKISHTMNTGWIAVHGNSAKAPIIRVDETASLNALISQKLSFW